ncbi:MAG: DegT/DnrJ/EryC1/StrS family aminotransferase [Phycisphaerae bacterium]|nr:DegT/DnrJ/EryC1/StrS family aminotransferase [Phycisphaerae bacterium]
MTRQNKINWPYEFPGAYWLDDQEESVVLDVLRNGSLFRYYGLGTPKHVDRFEERAREFYGRKYALALNSGTGALITAMAALDVGPGCEVILPAFLWVATVGAVVESNAIPVICEVDDSFSMDPADLEKKITSRTKLIVPIHMAGSPCDMNAILAVAKKHDIPVLEDCAQCNGGEFGGKKVGTFGQIGIFSLQLNKNMTCGEGGLLITDDERLYHKSFAAHDLGMIRKDGRLAPAPDYAQAWGQGRRMTELAGAVAAVQITKLPKILAGLRASKRRIREALKGTKGLGFRRLNDPAGDTGPFLILVLENEAKAVAALTAMKEAGLHNVFHVADYGLHIYSNIPSLVEKTPLSSAGNPWRLAENQESDHDYAKGACPNSDALFARSILLPIPAKLTKEQETQAVEIVKQAVEKA